MKTPGLSGGDKLTAYLANILKEAEQGETLRVGFLEDATYPDGTQVAMVAATQEFGGKIKVMQHEQTIYRSVKADGSFNKNGKFVKADKSNYATTHNVEAYEITIPARPFFRNMIAAKSSGWGKSMAATMKKTDFDVNQTLGLTGELIRGQLQESIRDFTTPANARSTIAKKGFNHPLIDSGVMLNSVDWDLKGNM